MCAHACVYVIMSLCMHCLLRVGPEGPPGGFVLVEQVAWVCVGRHDTSRHLSLPCLLPVACRVLVVGGGEQEAEVF